EEGESLRTFVQLVQQHDERTLLGGVQNAHSDENTATLILSTAHKAKGREWDSVRLAGDFAKTGPDGKQTFNEAESRHVHVAMPRAKRSLVVDPRQLTHITQKKWVRKPARAR